MSAALPVGWGGGGRRVDARPEPRGSRGKRDPRRKPKPLSISPTHVRKTVSVGRRETPVGRSKMGIYIFGRWFDV